MTNDSSPQVRLILCDNEGVGRITVGLEAFFEFSFSLAEELQDLVAQHEEFVHVGAQRDIPRLRHGVASLPSTTCCSSQSIAALSGAASRAGQT